VPLPIPPEVKGDEPPSKTLGGIRDLVSDVWKLYTAPPPSGSFMDALGDFQGNLQRTTFSLQKYVKEMTRQFPDKLHREAMTNWVQAEGDNETLARWASLSKGRTRKAYVAAMNLSEEEKTAAQNVRNMFDSYWEIGREAGVLDSFIENYVPQIRKPGSKFTSRVLAEIMGGFLRTDFKFAKRRVFETYFDGEQAGYPALDKDIGFHVTTYVRALVKAIEGRGLVRNLLETYAKDGRPLATISGVGRVVRDPTTGQRVHFVNPNIKPEEASDYRSISHPALRKWIWAGKDVKGGPIFLQGDIIVHPSIFKHLDNVLKVSAFRQPDAEWYLRVGNEALAASTFLKQSFLGPFSTFHQFQVGLHGLMHRVQPFHPPEINMSDPDQMGLVNGGLLVANPDGAVSFEEGLVAGGIWDQIPGAGRWLRGYKDYLFKDYIPRLKMSMGLAALERNKARYDGKLSLAQIYRMTGAQANAAFGELNYIMLGRNKTLQDAMRLILLSPDFTEARARFVGQAVKPGGKEQAAALAIGASLLVFSAYTLSRILQANFPDKKVEWHPNDPFRVRVGAYEYDVRSIQGDMMSLGQDWRSFIEARLNPATAKPVWEFATGRDSRGMPRTFAEQVHDYFYGLVPISMQGVSEQGRHFWESVLGAFGIRARKFYSPAGRLALEIHQQDMAGKSRRHETSEMVQDRQEVSKLFQQLNDGEAIPPEKIDAMQQQGTISPYTANRLREAKPGDDPLLSLFASLGIQDKIDVWEKASPEERSDLIGEFVLTRRDMRELRALPPAEMDKVISRYNVERDKAQVEPQEPTPAPEPSRLMPPFGIPAPRPAPEPVVQ
jgi:hypothetical protein